MPRVPISRCSGCTAINADAFSTRSFLELCRATLAPTVGTRHELATNVKWQLYGLF